MIDALGIDHPSAGAEARVVSLVPSITELLFVLGLGAQVVGRTGFCIHPREQVATVPKVGGTKNVRMERLRGLEPSHVILNIDENTREDAEEIARFVPHVVVTHPLAPGDNVSLYRLMGGLFRRTAEAEKLAAEFETELVGMRAAASELPRRKVLYLIWPDPWMTVSRDTYISRTLDLVNWETAGHLARTRYPQIDPGSGILQQVDVVLFSSEPYPFKAKHLDEFQRTYHPGRAQLIQIDGEMVSWYGSRAIRGLRYLLDLAQALDAPAPG